MKKVLLIALPIILGLGLIAYPFVSGYLASRNATREIAGYKTQVRTLDPAVVERQLKEAKIYNDALAGDPVHDPFIPGSGIALDQNYARVLDMGDGVMGHVSIPAIDVDLPIRHGTSSAVLLKGVGHVEGTSFPIGGARTHAVLTGHTGVSSARLFTDLTDLKKGDTFFIHVLDKTLAYQIDNIEVVLPSDTEDLRLVPGKDYVTLVTCTPYGVNSHRLFVRGVRIPYKPELEKAAARRKKGLTHEQRLIVWTAAGTTAFMGVVIVVADAIKRHRDNRYIPKH